MKWFYWFKLINETTELIQLNDLIQRIKGHNSTIPRPEFQVSNDWLHWLKSSIMLLMDELVNFGMFYSSMASIMIHCCRCSFFQIFFLKCWRFFFNLRQIPSTLNIHRNPIKSIADQLIANRELQSNRHSHANDSSYLNSIHH